MVTGATMTRARRHRWRPSETSVSAAGLRLWGHGVAGGGEAPAELAEHLDEVRAEPLIGDLCVVVESEGEDERRVDGSPGRLLHEQPWSLLGASNVVEDDDHVVFG